jgi:hypothetical protein
MELKENYPSLLCSELRDRSEPSLFPAVDVIKKGATPERVPLQLFVAI